jgi:hypothetical protein
MTEQARGEDFNPISELVRLSNLIVATNLGLASGTESLSGSEKSKGMTKIAEEAAFIKRHCGISDEDFFEAVVHGQGWEDRITYVKAEEE